MRTTALAIRRTAASAASTRPHSPPWGSCPCLPRRRSGRPRSPKVGREASTGQPPPPIAPPPPAPTPPARRAKGLTGPPEAAQAATGRG
eukprot:scaffold11461_cov104-Isochrysis_galbana.AAC.3